MDSIDRLIQQIKASTKSESEAKPDDTLPYPTKEEIRALNHVSRQMIQNYNNKDFPVEAWNGDIYRIVFEEITKHAFKINEDPWDVFAVFLGKLHGLKIVKTQEGEYAVMIVKNGKSLPGCSE